VRKLTLIHSIVFKRDRFDILALLSNAQNAQGTSKDNGATPGHKTLAGME